MIVTRETLVSLRACYVHGTAAQRALVERLPADLADVVACDDVPLDDAAWLVSRVAPASSARWALWCAGRALRRSGEYHDQIRDALRLVRTDPAAAARAAWAGSAAGAAAWAAWSAARVAWSEAAAWSAAAWAADAAEAAARSAAAAEAARGSAWWSAEAAARSAAAAAARAGAWAAGAAERGAQRRALARIVRGLS